MFGEMRDTPRTERDQYFERLASLSIEERARLLSAATARMRTFVRAGLAHFHPNANDDELRIRMAVRLYGRAAAERIFKNVPADAT